MSYDLQLYRKDSKKEPLSYEELKKLNEKFVVSNVFEKHGKILGFEVKYRNNQPDWIKEGFDISWQGSDSEDDRAYYQTYISYSANEEMHTYFNDLINDVSDELQLEIVNPQMGEEDPETEREQIHEAIKNDENAKNEQYNNILNNPSTFVFDFQVEIRSWPKDFNSYKTLYANGDQMYRGTVEKQEKLHDKLEEIVPILIGDNQYKIVSLKEIDASKAKEITDNPLLRVVIEIEHFDPKSRNLKYDMSWKSLTDFV